MLLENDTMYDYGDTVRVNMKGIRHPNWISDVEHPTYLGVLKYDNRTWVELKPFVCYNASSEGLYDEPKRESLRKLEGLCKDDEGESILLKIEEIHSISTITLEDENG